MNQKEIASLQANHLELQKKLNLLLNHLNLLDQERNKHTQDLVKAENNSQVAAACAGLYHQTELSLDTLSGIQATFQKMTESHKEIFAFLKNSSNSEENLPAELSESLHKFSLTQNFIKNNLSQLFKLRKKQLNYISLLTKNLDHFKSFLSRFYYKNNLKRINFYLGQEMLLFHQILIKEESDTNKIKEFIGTLNTEKKRKIVISLLATLLIFTPIPLVSLPGFALLKTYDFFNQYTENHQRLKNLNHQLLEKQWALT